MSFGKAGVAALGRSDPDHELRRNIVNRGFTPRRVSNSEAKIRQVCTELINRVCEQGSCEFVTQLAAPLPTVLIGDVLGVAPEDRDQLLEWSDRLRSRLFSHTHDADVRPARPL